MNRCRLICLMLLLSLLLSGCAAARVESQPTAAPTPAATPEPTPRAPEERLRDAAQAAMGVSLRQALSGAEVYAALESAWDSAAEALPEKPGRAASRAEGGVGDVVCTLGDYVFVLRGKGVAVLNIANGYNCPLTSFAAGFEWKETVEDGVWIGREKAPTELYVCEGRLVVVSDWFEYRDYTQAEGQPRFEDGSHTCVDIFDISDITAPRRVASYGQDGYQSCGGLTGDSLCIVTQRRLYDAECDPANEDSYLPGTYNGEERRAVDASDIEIISGNTAALYTLICTYDLSGCQISDARAVLGRTEMVSMAGENLYLFGRQAVSVALEPRNDDVYTVTDCLDTVGTAVLRFSAGAGGILYANSAVVEGTLYDVYAAHADGAGITLETTVQRAFYSRYVDPRHGFDNREDERSQTELLTTRLSLPMVVLSESVESAEGETVTETFWPWIGDQVVAVETDGTITTLLLYDREDRDSHRVVAAFPLGYDYREAPESRRAVYVDPQRSLVGVPATDSYTFLHYEESTGFTRLTDLFTRDTGGNVRVLDRGEVIYILDTQEIRALRPQDMAVLWERTF